MINQAPKVEISTFVVVKWLDKVERKGKNIYVTYTLAMTVLYNKI